MNNPGSLSYISDHIIGETGRKLKVINRDSPHFCLLCGLHDIIHLQIGPDSCLDFWIIEVSHE